MDLANKSHRSYNLIVIRQSETKYKTGAWWEGTKRQTKGKTIFTSNALRTPPKSYISDSFLKKNPRYNLRWYKCYSDHVNAYKLLQLRWKHNINRECSSVHAVSVSTRQTEWERETGSQCMHERFTRRHFNISKPFRIHPVKFHNEIPMNFIWNSAVQFSTKPNQTKKAKWKIYLLPRSS